MITDTSFYRNKNYHETTDDIQSIDFSKMAAVIYEVKYAIENVN